MYFFPLGFPGIGTVRFITLLSLLFGLYFLFTKSFRFTYLTEVCYPQCRGLTLLELTS